MAFVVARTSGTWEIRESRATSAGPRSHTLASFHTLSADVVEKAQARSPKPLDQARLRRAAARAGAPIDPQPGDRAAGELLAELAAGRHPRALLRRLLLDALGDEHERKRSSDSARAAAAWVSATPQRRGAALRDLLLLADRFPRRRRPPALSFPPDPPSGAVSKSSLPEKVLGVHERFSQARIAHAFGGALALAYYAEPRATIDIDVNVFVPPSDRERVQAALQPIGVQPLDALATDRDGQCRTWWDDTPLDVFFAYDELHRAMRHAARVLPFGEDRIPVLAPEHLVICKAIFDRPKDWLDIEQVLVCVEDLDTNEIRASLRRIVGAQNPRCERFEQTVATVLDG